MMVICNTEPEKIQYMPLPDGRADVWLRKDIHEDVDDYGGITAWVADEVYFRTNLSKEEVEERFDELYANRGDGSSQADEDEISAEEALQIIMGVM